MIPPDPIDGRWVLALSILMLGGIAPVGGQALSPLEADGEWNQVEARIGSSPTMRSEEWADDLERRRLRLRLLAETAYESNIYLSRDSVKADTVIRLSPQVEGQWGGDRRDDGGHVRLAYTPTRVMYLGNEGSDRTDQKARLEAGWRGGKLGMAYEGVYQRMGDATADLGVQTERDEVAQVLRAAWQVSEKVAVEAALGHRETAYQEERFYDSKDRYVEVGMRYAYSPKTQLGVAYREGRFEVEDAGRQVVKRLTGRLEWSPREKVRVDMEAGLERREFDVGSGESPVVEARIGWRPGEGTEWYLGGYRREQASAFFPGQNIEQSGILLGVSKDFGRKWTGRLEGGVERADYRLVSGAGDVGRADRIWYVKPSLEYRPSDSWRWNLFYRYSENQSNRRDFGYDSSTAGLQIGYEF